MLHGIPASASYPRNRTQPFSQLHGHCCLSSGEGWNTQCYSRKSLPATCLYSPFPPVFPRLHHCSTTQLTLVSSSSSLRGKHALNSLGAQRMLLALWVQSQQRRGSQYSTLRPPFPWSHKLAWVNKWLSIMVL